MDETLVVSFENFKKCITPKTKAILFSFYYGSKYDPKEIYDYCNENNIIIFEDEA